MRKRYLYPWTLLLIIICCAAQAQNHDSISSGSPYFKVSSEDGSVTDKLPLILTSVDVNILGFVADVTVTQHYKNEGDTTLEAVYIFPGSESAAVYDMSMQIGDRVIRSVVKEKQEAKQVYTDAVNSGRTASLLEQSDNNFFKTSVGNILPGDDIRVTLKYTETIIPDDGLYRFSFPATRGARRETNAPPKQGELSDSIGFDIAATVKAAFPIAYVDSPSHPVNIEEYKNSVAVTLHEDAFFSGDEDFVLEYRLSGNKIQSGLMLYEGSKENYFLLMAQPPEKVLSEDIPARDYRFVVDVSGSMAGFPLEISKQIVSEMLVQLRPNDYFNIHLFSSANVDFQDHPVAASSESIDAALALLDVSGAGGGTQLLPVLQKLALEQQDEGLSRIVVIVTDGAIAADAQTLRFINANLNDLNVFVFGVGRNISEQMIHRLAEAGQGESFIMNQQNELSPQIINNFVEYIGMPVLSDIGLQVPPGFETYDVFPRSIPDVFAQRPVYVTGKWRGRPAGSIVLNGYSGSSLYQDRFPLHAAASSGKNDVIRLLWARQKIDNLTAQESLHFQPQYRDELIDLGVQHNLLTKYTSFVSVDDEVRASDESLEQIKLQRNRAVVVKPSSTVGYGMSAGPIAMALHEPVQRELLADRLDYRDRFPLPADPFRRSITFILGQDGATENQFYAAASDYFQQQENAQVVAQLRNLAEVKEWLQLNKPEDGAWGIINIVSHATPWTGADLSSLIPGFDEEQPDRKRDAGLSVALDAYSQIRFYGCGLGLLPEQLDSIARYMSPTKSKSLAISSPTVPILFSSTLTGGKAEFQALSHWWVVSNTRKALSEKALVKRLQGKHGQRDWAAMLKQPLAGVLPALNVESINIRVKLKGYQATGRVTPVTIAKRQEQLIATLTNSGIALEDLRWSINKEQGDYILEGRGWLHQVVSDVERAENDLVYAYLR